MKTNIIPNKTIDLTQVVIDNETYFKISNNDEMRPFFMSIVSDSNHWMFISSNGGLTAGRKNSEYALFPYYTDDKITESAEVTGSKTIFRVKLNDKTALWEPFSQRFEGFYDTTRNLYKNHYGNKVIFEEINHDLGVTFRYSWNSSDRFGFVKKSTLINNSNTAIEVELLDGIQNIIPYGIGSDLQNAYSNLVDAYKRNELDAKTNMGIYALSAIIVDKAEPSEALKTNIVWSLGFDNAKYLVSSLQLKNFRRGHDLQQETDVKAEKGGYFINTTLTLNSEDTKTWHIVAEVNLDHSDVAALAQTITTDSNLAKTIQDSIDIGTKRLIELNTTSDGLQLTNDNFKDARHFSNTLFNIMRGGIFDNNYQIEKQDFKAYILKANKDVANTVKNTVNALDKVFTVLDLKAMANASNDSDFKRLCLEYMPLKFSRRHGDPSRPWNKFSINTRSEVDGSKILDYEGNWRDIFQNWEALAHSYPEFIESMIHKFLNATTFDGYNPYRVTKGGFDWETIEPDDPWSYIGYWGDHQIIYLLKFLEFIEDYKPGQLEQFYNKDVFVYANVPYKIKSYQDILKNPKDTIEFDEALDHEIRQERLEIGVDGALLKDGNNTIVKVNFIEKILATTLAKLSNFIPEGGIWMNTQRPEWNDANNALVGNGVSMVTLYYLRRFLKFFDTVLAKTELEGVAVSKELVTFFNTVAATFKDNKGLLAGKINDADRKKVLDLLGAAGSLYRTQIYTQAFSGQKETIALSELKDFVSLSLSHLEHSIEANKRDDHLYHAYNLMTIEDNGAISVSYLSEMLEGQVAVLSSGFIEGKEALQVLDALKNSKLFRPDQYSYILYPNKELKGFLQRNNIPENTVANSLVLQQLLSDGHGEIIKKGVDGHYHFNGNFKNANDLEHALNAVVTSISDKAQVLDIFEAVFNHKEFTGRSGTFYGYEGLGSIYWHMVSKLLLAVQECCLKAIHNNESEAVIGRLLEHYYEINEGIGVHKSPELYGAFPTDPYSHTPGGKGAQQPGMTGQVKEDVLSRFGELGVFIKEGQVVFNPCLLRSSEFLKDSKTFHYTTVKNVKEAIELTEGTLCFTYCQVPVVYKIGSANKMMVRLKDGSTQTFNSLSLGETFSAKLFNRTDEITQIEVTINKTILK